MAASPVTGERPSGFRRSSSQFASIPHRSLSFHEKVGLANEDAAADVLYTHPSVRVYTFQPPTDALKSLDTTKKTLPDADYPIDAIEILPWRAKTETLAARGKLIIEKVQGSVHFLKAGELIHTIMKNSQCWCVDGESKFVMRVGRLRYQRIEMPTTEPEEKQKVEEFKEVISKILKFEKTPCPFIRAFQVDLPDDAITPRRRGTWKRKESLNSTPPDDEPRPIRRTKTARTMSMRGMPPNAFPSRSLTQLDMERPRTASTPHSTGRFSFPDVTIESPTTYTSGEDNTDSDRHDSESDRPETGHSSEIDESDREFSSVPILKAPVSFVRTPSPLAEQSSARTFKLHSGNDTSLAERQPSSTTEALPFLDTYQSGAAKAADKHSPTSRLSVQSAEQSPTATLNKVALTSVAPPASTPNTSQGVDSFAASYGLSSGVHDPQPPTVSVILPSVVDKPLDDYSSEPPVGLDAQKNELLSEVPSDLPIHEPATEPATTSVVSTADPDSTVETQPITESALESIETATSTTIRTRGTEPELPLDSLSRSRTNEDAESTVSGDSFHTLDDDLASIDRPSLGRKPFQHRRELSEMTVTADSVKELDQVFSSRAGHANEPVADLEQSDLPEQDPSWPIMRTPGAFTDDSEIRRRLQHRRSLSPLPPASILQSSNQIERGSPIPAVFLQKAASLAVVKPLEVFVFVVQVLARIAGGATMNDLVSGNLFRNPNVRRTASGTFDQDVRGRSSAGESEEEDDYGVPVHGRRKSSNKEERSGFTLSHEIDDAASYASID